MILGYDEAVKNMEDKSCALISVGMLTWSFVYIGITAGTVAPSDGNVMDTLHFGSGYGKEK